MPLKLNGEIIERVEEFKYLGMMLDASLTFEAHINYIYKKVCNKIGVIKKTRMCMDERIATVLYKSIILPILDYGDIVYMTANLGILNKLQQIQNVCCRIILRRNKRASVTEMHRELKLMKLGDRRDIHLSENCHKNIYYEAKPSLGSFFITMPARNQRETRQRNRMHMVVPRAKTTCGQQAFSIRGPKHWNGLTNDIRLVEKYKTFQRELRAKKDLVFDNHPT